jgi:hypothetical protein
MFTYEHRMNNKLKKGKCIVNKIYYSFLWKNTKNMEATVV